MNSKRLFFVLLGLFALMVIGMVGGAYGINSLLSGQSSKLVSLKAKSQALDQEQLSLNNAKKEIQKYSDLEQIASVVVPQDKDQAEAIREIVNIASANGIALGAITFPSSTLGSTTVEPTTSASSSVSTPSAATAPPVNLNSPTNKLSQLVAVKSVPGVYELAITVESAQQSFVPYNNFVNFLTALENNRRTSQVTSLSITPNPKDSAQLSFSLILDDYIKP